MTKPITVPGTVNEDLPLSDVVTDQDEKDAMDNSIPFNKIRINGVLVTQTLVYCPVCGDPRIQVESTAVFRLNNQSIWQLMPIDQDSLREELNKRDTPCKCTHCEWEGPFSELMNAENNLD